MRPHVASICQQSWPTVLLPKDRFLLSSGNRHYNPALARLPSGTLLMAYRYHLPSGARRLAVCELHDGQPDPRSQPLELPFSSAPGAEHQEDPRLFWHAGDLWLAYTEATSYLGDWRCRMRLVRLGCHDGHWHVTHSVGGNRGIDFRNNLQGREKNWQFFSHEGALWFVYSLKPHLVVQLDPDSGRVLGSCETPGIRGWAHGTLSGGTPPLLEGETYLSVFHSAEPHPLRTRRYSASVYRFAARPPFFVEAVTEPILYGSEEDGFCPAQDQPHLDPCVVFPSGAVWLHAGVVLVSSGINDHACALTRMNVSRLTFMSPEFPTPEVYFRTDRASIPVVIDREIRARWQRTRCVGQEWHGVLAVNDPNLVKALRHHPGAEEITLTTYRHELAD